MPARLPDPPLESETAWVQTGLQASLFTCCSAGAASGLLVSSKVPLLPHSLGPGLVILSLWNLSTPPAFLPSGLWVERPVQPPPTPASLLLPQLPMQRAN